jgi:hypothetical protein
MIEKGRGMAWNELLCIILRRSVRMKHASRRAAEASLLAPTFDQHADGFHSLFKGHSAGPLLLGVVRRLAKDGDVPGGAKERGHVSTASVERRHVMTGVFMKNTLP